MMISFADTDEMRWLTRAVALGVAAAFVLALIGGMPVALPMPTHAVGMVDPTCGLTRASIALAHGDLLAAWRFNPAVFVLAGIAVAVVLRTVWGLTQHRWVSIRMPVTAPRIAIAVVVLAGWWAYQQANAQFIMDTRYP
jgi:hypothetical protein